MDRTQRDKLESFVSQGRVILFTGAGFSLDAKNRSGEFLPTVNELAKTLWDIAFPREPYEPSSLGDVYEAAHMQASKETQRQLRQRLTVDPSSINESYLSWFSFPWHRIYTLNIDDLDEAASRAFDFSRPLHPISALSEASPPPEEDALQVIHLNGTLNDLPDITFSQRQYGERLGRSDLWYDSLARELKTHPVLYVGTSLDEPPLWAYVEARGPRSAENETRPGSFLVSPELERARRVSLSMYNVSWVKASAVDFADDVLAGLSGAASKGRRAIEQRRGLERGIPPLARVSDIQADSQEDEREFLHGREPRWSDLTAGFAIKRGFDTELAQNFPASERLLVITGTAGSGKSTSAMRLALQRSAMGEDVFVFNQDASAGIYHLRSAVSASGADFLLIDDADRFGPSTSSFLQELLEENPALRIVVCVRNTMIHVLDDLRERGTSWTESVVPHLEDADVDALLDALDRANRLGMLKGKSRKQQREAMQKTYGRQLLVALLEVTQGVRLEQKVKDECNDLSGAAPLVYAVSALATYAGGPLTDQELISAAGDASRAVEQIDLLTRRHMLIRTSSKRLMPRHKVIAERVVRHFSDRGTIAEICTALAVGLAAHAQIGELRASRTGRLLVRLLNHEYLMRLVYRNEDPAVDKATVRRIYDSVEPILRDDYQYWLQRGSFETEDGDLDLAKNFMEQARGMNEGDPNVRTEWSYMTLKRATRNVDSPDAVLWVEEGFEELEDLMGKKGPRNYHAYHIYGSQGLAWVRRAPLAREEKKELLERLRRVVREGLGIHRQSKELQRLSDALEREYMMLAVDVKGAGSS